MVWHVDKYKITFKLVIKHWTNEISVSDTCYTNVINLLKPNDIYTECSRRNGQNFGRVFLMLKYTDITQNTYIQS